MVREEIERTGPMPVSAYMHMALNHPAHGYYATRRPIGAAGDFTTAPEISQMFGELVGAWVAALDLPDAALVEIGPGRGTLAADVTRTLAALGRAHALHLVETSPTLRDEQRETIAASATSHATWHETFEAAVDATDGPLVVVANELLDALPVRQLVRSGGAWRERVVVVDGGTGALAFAAGPAAVPIADRAPEGTLIEIAPAREALVALVATAIAERGGAALFVDYGSLDGGAGDTLQAVRRHEPVDPLAHIGEADLTTQVDFAPLRTVAAERGCRTAATTQGAFLLDLGLLERAGRLGHARPERQEEIRAQVERLAGPQGMGELFKVLAMWHPALATPPGLGAGK